MAKPLDITVILDYMKFILEKSPMNVNSVAYLGVTTHRGENFYECKQSGKAFEQITSLQLHEKIHTGEKLYECKCVSYNKKHIEEKTVYKCEQCSKTFLWHSKVTNHERIHTGKKPYQCKQCGRAFRYRSHLQRCERTQAKEKPYECKQCGKAFIEKHFSYTKNLH
ncbi:zinc finger protein 14-like [Microtus oregoni]|uniref:zinc finger protein 14-like n=1 Tax=Microtus oregoni TaxID=111838 RepID=UPI001BB23C49|nr:zinc finger protein 14-like [Microtus oregoni]